MHLNTLCQTFDTARYTTRLNRNYIRLYQSSAHQNQRMKQSHESAYRHQALRLFRH